MGRHIINKKIEGNYMKTAITTGNFKCTNPACPVEMGLVYPKDIILDLICPVCTEPMCEIEYDYYYLDDEQSECRDDVGELIEDADY